MYNSGITTLNLAISGQPDSFARAGNIVSYIGESDSGKTILALTSMAASFYSAKEKIRPLFYAFEPNLLIDMTRLYGKKFTKALEVVTDLDMTLEEWQADVRKRLDAAKLPMIVTLDSTDALTCRADLKAADEITKGTTKAGYGTNKAAAYSRAMPEIAKSVKNNGGLLILLSQIRENPAVMFGSPLRRSGGKALDFYSEIRVWLSSSNREVIGDIRVGGWTKIEVRRNKVTGDARTIYAPIYPSYGVDDTRSMLHFLAESERGAKWGTKNMNTIIVGERTDTLAKMAAYYESDATKVNELRSLVVEAWEAREKEIVNDLFANRGPRFG